MKKKTKDRVNRIEERLQHLTLQVEELKLSMHGDTPGHHDDDGSPVTAPKGSKKTGGTAPAKPRPKKAK
jgi:hypothetical protein